MHEQSIVESILELALEHAEKADAKKIVGIYLVVGELSGVVDEAVEFYFRFLSRDTVASEARIIFTHVPVKLCCRNCNTIFTPQDLDFRCPECQEKQVDIVAGRELYIESLEVE
jgi:hydrogenase nickel incorporation protein HypA/HybF